MASEEITVFSPDAQEGSSITVDMAKQKVVFGGSNKHQHNFVPLETQDPATPHLTYVECTICGVEQILKTGDNFTEKDVLLDGKINRRKSPLTKKEKNFDADKGKKK